MTVPESIEDPQAAVNILLPKVEEAIELIEQHSVFDQIPIRIWTDLLISYKDARSALITIRRVTSSHGEPKE